MGKKKFKLDTSNNLNLSLFPPTTNWVMPSSFPDLSGAKLIGCDTETKDPFLKEQGPGFIRKDAYVAGISLATEDKAWYFPMRHLGGGNLDPGIVTSYVHDVMKLPCPKVFANAAYDLEALWSEDIEVKGSIYDVQIIEALLEEEREEDYALETLCKSYLGRQKDEKLLQEAATAYGVPIKGGLWKLPSKYVGAYGEYDAFSLIPIFKKQLIRLEKEDLLRIHALESKVTPVLHKMRIQGVPIDVEGLDSLSVKLKDAETKLYDEMLHEHKEKINPHSGLELAGACERKGIKYLRTSAGFPSFEGEWLENHEHPFLQLIATIRQTSKVKKDFVDSLGKKIINGRLHTQWIQLKSDEGGTKSGRLASKNPNLQQIPACQRRNGKPNPAGAAVRALFIPEKGMQWMKCDYAGQEPRILVHFAALCKMGGAEAAAFAFRANPKMSFYVDLIMPMCNVNKRRAKDIYLSISYNQGLAAFAQSIGQSKDSAKEILADFNSKVPFIREISDKCTLLAKTRGYVKTLLGRKRHFNYWEPVNAYQLKQELFHKGLSASEVMDIMRPRPLPLAKEHWPKEQLTRAHTHKGLNSVIQGSAADMMKAGLVKGYEEDGRIPYLSAHDEIDGPVKDETDGNRWKKTMETCVDMCVPMLGEMFIGKHWK